MCPHTTDHLYLGVRWCVGLVRVSRKGSSSVPGSSMVNSMGGTMELRCS